MPVFGVMCASQQKTEKTADTREPARNMCLKRTSAGLASRGFDRRAIAN
jgi:hypothetical protein